MDVIFENGTVKIKTVGGWWVWVYETGYSGIPTMGRGEYIFQSDVGNY
jgi:hypothetical protein